jgi:uncharacterized protein (DUF1810 family)
MTAHDPHDLQRFLDAQGGGTSDGALAELRRGRKTGHWMWFVFPQIAGLGRSPMAQRYAIASLDEARAYLAHPILTERLHACCAALLDGAGTSADAVLGGIDAQKLHSSVTLFARADPADPVFPAVLEKFYGGVADDATDRLL